MMKNKIKYTTLLIFILVIFSNCNDQIIDCPNLFEIRPPDSQLIWVGKLFVGDRQCEPFDNYTPPNTKCLLNQSGIPVFETKIEHHPVCTACSCPLYSATHYALIKKEHLVRAEQIGFQRKDHQ